MTAHVDTRKQWIRSRRNKRKQARRARVHRQLFRYLILIGILVGGCQAFAKLPWHISNPQTDVIVQGNGVATADQLRAALAHLCNKPIYQINPREVERQAAELKAVKYAFVRRYAFPKPTVIVNIMEEFPWATFATSPEADPSAVIAQSGRMIPIKDFPHITQPPLRIYGAANLKLTSKEVSQWGAWAAYIAEQTGETVASVDLRKPFDVRVQDGDLYLKLGTVDATMTRRLGRLSSIVVAVQPLKGRLEYIDLSLDNNIPLRIAKTKGDGKHDLADRLQQAQLPGSAPL